MAQIKISITELKSETSSRLSVGKDGEFYTRMVGPLLEVIYFLHSTENFIDRENIKLLDNPVVDVRFYSLKEKISFKRQVNMLSDTLNKKYGLIINEEKKSEEFIVVKEDQSLFPIYADRKKNSSIKVENEFIVFENEKLSGVIDHLRFVYGLRIVLNDVNSLGQHKVDFQMPLTAIKDPSVLIAFLKKENILAEFRSFEYVNLKISNL